MDWYKYCMYINSVTYLVDILRTLVSDKLTTTDILFRLVLFLLSNLTVPYVYVGDPLIMYYFSLICTQMNRPTCI